MSMFGDAKSAANAIRNMEQMRRKREQLEFDVQQKIGTVHNITKLPDYVLWSMLATHNPDRKEAAE